MNRLKIAQYIALAEALVLLVGILLDKFTQIRIGPTILSICILLGFVAYIFGGFGTAFKMAGKIAKWGWFIAPFPFDLVTFGVSFSFAFMVFFFLPIIPIRKAYKEKCVKKEDKESVVD
ncbi:MAG: hypothetical protein PUE95_07425 [Lachnospiraceae bacterium]|nr:hypothetical protein [Lachnospiraceae bacterium]